TPLKCAAQQATAPRASAFTFRALSKPDSSGGDDTNTGEPATRHLSSRRFIFLTNPSKSVLNSSSAPSGPTGREQIITIAWVARSSITPQLEMLKTLPA
ncbi:hypothetical protein MHYP_G00249540, partial [Metynnis hypsauchen]